MTSLWLAAVLPAVVAAIAIALLARSPLARRLADVPNERSLHARPTPRVGGICLVAAALPFVASPADISLAALAALAAALAIVSLADDVRSLPIAVRLPAHVAAAVLAMLAIASPQPGHAGIGLAQAALTVIAIVWATNLYNFMDGSDGIAGGMALIGFGALAAAALAARQWPLAAACAALASASLGFLAHNFPPARVFLGDAGSIPLGFLAATLGLHGWLQGAWPLAFPLVVFSPFIADATVTLARRMLRREPFWRAHRSHYYQRLVLAGWSRRALALAAYALMLSACAIAFALRIADARAAFAIIGGWTVFYAFLFLAIERRLRDIAT